MSEVWLITGASRGLGRAILEAALHSGAVRLQPAAQSLEAALRDGAAAIFGPGTPIATAAIKIMEILLDEQK